MDETADPADPFCDENIFGIFTLFHEFLEAPVDVADRGNNIHDRLVLEHEIEVQGFGEDGVLGPEGDDHLFRHGLSSFPVVTLKACLTAVR